MTLDVRRLTVGFVFLIMSCVGAVGSEEFIGTWVTEKGEAHIRVAKCGAQMCGTIVWLRDPNDPKTGKPQMDDLNPNPSLRTRPVLGMRIFAMDQDATGSWTGPIYNSTTARTTGAASPPRGPTPWRSTAAPAACAAPNSGSA